MNKVTSKDGTRIAFDRAGSGPALVLVDGALCHRKFGPGTPLADSLAANYTVFTYDRRGRGDSGDTAPYSVEREVEDIEAMIKEAGEPVFLYGISSGAALALEAANHDLNIKKLALYEAPFIVDDTHPARPDDYIQTMESLIAGDKRGDAVKLFMKTVGVPAFGIFMMRLMPVWSKLQATAHTLPYDFRVLGDTGKGKPLPADRWTSVMMPTLVMDGGKSPAWMRNGMRGLADVLPNAQYRTLEGQDHMIKPKGLTPSLLEFFK